MFRMRKLFYDEAGLALVDSMVGILIAALAMIGLSSIAVTASEAITRSDSQTARQNYIVSLANELANDPVAVPTTPTTTNITIHGVDSQVSSWRVTTAAGTIIYTSTSRDESGSGTDCANPANNSSDCLRAASSVLTDLSSGMTTEITTTWSTPALDGPTPAAVTSGPLGSFNTPAGLTEVRYVLRIAGSPGGAVVFTDPAISTTLGTVTIGNVPDQYFYGSLPTTGTTNVEITYSGGQAWISRFFIYEAPQ